MLPSNRASPINKDPPSLCKIRRNQALSNRVATFQSLYTGPNCIHMQLPQAYAETTEGKRRKSKDRAEVLQSLISEQSTKCPLLVNIFSMFLTHISLCPQHLPVFSLSWPF